VPAQEKPHETGIESAKATRDLETWERAWAEGGAMSLDEAADYALLSN
jgi:hypothetical protein